MNAPLSVITYELSAPFLAMPLAAAAFQARKSCDAVWAAASRMEGLYNGEKPSPLHAYKFGIHASGDSFIFRDDADGRPHSVVAIMEHPIEKVVVIQTSYGTRRDADVALTFLTELETAMQAAGLLGDA